MRKAFIIIAIVILIIIIFNPSRHATYYNYIAPADILNEIVINELTIKQSNLTFCPRNYYNQLLQNGKEVHPQDIFIIKEFIPPNFGGEYIPKDCKPIFTVAIIVPYRNRDEQLQLFLNYMHRFLQQQKLHYRLYVVEQNDDLAFNRARMLNVGANEAMKMNFSCLILHDVDLFPLNLQNIYACFNNPRHMSSSIDSFRYNLPYLGLSGGAFAIQSKHFKQINGMSNVFNGWGGEDDDFFTRLKEHDLIPIRLPPQISSYTMLVHKKQTPNKDRRKILEFSVQRQTTDGLNSIPNNYRVELEWLFTHILV